MTDRDRYISISLPNLAAAEKCTGRGRPPSLSPLRIANSLIWGQRRCRCTRRCSDGGSNPFSLSLPLSPDCRRRHRIRLTGEWLTH